jgi:hypothetical protein
MASPKKRLSKVPDDLVRPIALASVKPAPENSLLYRPVSSDDPSIRDLAIGIKRNGILEPIVITKDQVILSGHRRCAAARLAGLTHVPCRIANITSDDPRLVELITFYNQQRVKTLDEFLREAIATANPEESYQALIEHRQKRAELEHGLAKIELRGYKGRKAISRVKYEHLDAIIAILNDNRDYWPLSVRQVHYRLLSDPPLTNTDDSDSVYRNDHNSYRKTIDLITRARLDSTIPFQAISDETRPVTTWDVHKSPESFIKAERDRFLKNYFRDLLQSQPNHIEVIGEKLTIEGIIRPICMGFCVAYTIGRGYSSLDPRYKLVQRFKKSGKEKLVLLVLSDFDPAGEEIAHSFARSLRDDFDIDESRMEPIKVALTPDQIRELELPPQLEAKIDDPNYARFIERYLSTTVFELDAVEPADLARILTNALDSVIDIEAFNAELEREKQDAARLDAVRKTVFEALRGLNLED